MSVAARWSMAALAVVGALLASCSSDAADDRTSSVTIFGPYRGVEAERFMADLEPWAERRGVDVRYTGTGNLATDLRSRVAAGSPPDLAIVPQPGLLADLHEQGALVELPAPVEEIVSSADIDAVAALGRFDGAQFGLPFRVSAKGLVWYRPAVFDELGLEVPTTLDEMRTLVAELAEGDQPPWCFGIEAQAATGWAATDWIENLVIRQAGIDVYRDWIAGDVDFADPRIERSFDWFSDVVLQPRLVAGGINGVLSTPVADAIGPLFADPPGCVLHQQASFAISWMPDDVVVGPDGDVDFFLLPPDDPDEGTPVVVGLDTVVSFAHGEAVDQVLEYLSSEDAVETWVEAGGFLSPLTVLADGRPTAEVLIGRRIEAASAVAIDASDAMEPEIGSALFLSEIRDWVARTTTFEELASTIDDARSGRPG